MADLLPISLDDMIAEAKRELAMRPSVYARLVAFGKLRQDRADWQIEVQRAIVDKLESLKVR